MIDDLLIVGLDEAGVGPGFGSLWASAVYLPSPIDGLKDSKVLSVKKRLHFRELILKYAWVGVGEVNSVEIDSLGMAECRRLVFERALQDFEDKYRTRPSSLRIDGTIFREWKGIPFELHVKGDSKFPDISAAGIIAKTTRDLQIQGWCDSDPELNRKYDILSNKGYLTPKHILGIQQYGMVDLHRKTFHCKKIDYSFS